MTTKEAYLRGFLTKLAAAPIDPKLLAEVTRQLRSAMSANPLRPIKMPVGPTKTETYQQWLARFQQAAKKP